MRRLHRFLQLSRHERVLFLQAASLLVISCCGLRILSLPALRRLLARAAPRSRVASPLGLAASEIVQAVRRAGRLLPGATCLAQALAAQTLLGAYGHHAVVRIGVTRMSPKKLAAHAWVEQDGAVILGGDASESYTPLVSLVMAVPIRGESSLACE